MNSGNQEIRKSSNHEFRKSGHQQIMNSGKQEIIILKPANQEPKPSGIHETWE
jgi:hypothetical protein